MIGSVNKEQLLQPSAIALIAANLLPLGGVLFLAWPIFPLVLLFWMENLIVGLLNIPKMALAGGSDSSAHVAKLVMIPFFCLHYGLFCFVHGMFVLVLFGGPDSGIGGGGAPSVARLMDAIRQWHLGWAMAALLGSHAVSFFFNYIGKGEFREASLPLLMGAPYARIVVLHVAILLGAFVLVALGSPVVGLIILVIGKTVIDLKAHFLERGRFSSPASRASAEH